jgi:DNA-binding LytR/AlgR family response regulator
MSRVGRVLLRVSEFRHVPVDPAEVYFLEAVGEHTMVRLRSKKRLRDLRRLGTLLKDFAPYGFVRVHRNHAVNLVHIGEIRQRKGRQDWEVKLESPVNRVLPVSRAEVGKLLNAFGSEDEGSG